MPKIAALGSNGACQSAIVGEPMATAFRQPEDPQNVKGMLRLPLN
jgi:hypothetical protein